MPFSQSIVDRVNAAHVTMDDLTTVIERMDRPTGEDDFFTAVSVAAIAQHSPDQEKAYAVTFRLVALARFICETGGHGWAISSESPDHGSFMHGALVHAASIQPISVKDDEVYFDVENLRVCSLQNVEPEGYA